MIRIGFDSDELTAIPHNAQVVFYYSDLVKEYAVIQAMFPGRPVVLIDRGLGDPTGLASVGDFETGALKIADAPAWFDKKTTHGVRELTGYVNRSNLQQFDNAIAERKVGRWVATLDGTMHIPGFAPGKHPALVQFASAEMLGFHADASVIWDDLYHQAPALKDAELLLHELLSDLTVVMNVAPVLRDIATKMYGNLSRLS